MQTCLYILSILLAINALLLLFSVNRSEKNQEKAPLATNLFRERQTGDQVRQVKPMGQPKKLKWSETGHQAQEEKKQRTAIREPGPMQAGLKVG